MWRPAGACRDQRGAEVRGHDVVERGTVGLEQRLPLVESGAACDVDETMKRPERASHGKGLVDRSRIGEVGELEAVRRHHPRHRAPRAPSRVGLRRCRWR